MTAVFDRGFWELATWATQPDHYDLVACLYVDMAGSVEETAQSLSMTSFLVGLWRLARTTDPM